MKTDSLIDGLARGAGLASCAGRRKVMRVDGQGMEHSR